MGEASKNLSESFRESFAEVPWREIIGMRNFMQHVYMSIKVDILWTTATQDVPDVMEKLNIIFLQLQKNDSK